MSDPLRFRSVAVWLGALIFVAFFSSIHGSFHFDDSHSVESNIAIRSMKNIPQFWTQPETSSFIPENRVYRPLVYTFYSIAWAIGEGETWPFHLMKMAMHWFVCLALFLIWQRLWQIPGWFPGENRKGLDGARPLELRFPFIRHRFYLNPTWAAFFLTTLFAVHPAVTECVDYISATTSLQCAMFYVWAFVFFLWYRDGAELKWLGFSLLFYFFSVSSKEEGITLLAIVPLTEFFLLKDPQKSLSKEQIKSVLRRGAPFFVLGLILFAWIWGMRPSSGDESRGTHSSMSYFMTQWRAWLWYMRLWFWPFDLNADSATVTFSKSFFDPLVIQALIGNALIVSFAALNRHRFPALFYGLCWYYITISPASSVVVLAEAINEHRMYLAYIGFVGGVMSLLLSLARVGAEQVDSRKLGWIYSLVMIGLMVGTQERNRVWLNDENLWLDTVEKNPTSGRALNNLALVYLSKGDFQKSVQYLEQCERHWSTYMYCPLNRGIALKAMGKKEEAASAFAKAYGLNTNNTHVNFHYGVYWQEMAQNSEKALFHFQQADRVTGGRYPAAKRRMALILQEQKKYNEAARLLQEAVEVEPGNEGAWFDLGGVKLQLNQTLEAAKCFERVLLLDQKNSKAWYNLGIALMRSEEFERAKRSFSRMLELDPTSYGGWYHLSRVAEKLRDTKLALTAAKKVVQIQPSNLEDQKRVADLEGALND